MADHFTVGLNLVDDSFNKDETRNYGLAVFYSDTRFSCCVLDYKRNKFISVLQFIHAGVPQTNAGQGLNSSYPDFQESIFSSIPWLNNPFKSVKVAYEGRKSTLIPARVFDPHETANYLAFNFPMVGEEMVSYDHLPSVDSYHVFSVPPFISQAIGEHFREAEIVHASSVLIESTWINYKNRINAPRVFLHVRHLFFDLMIFDGKQMTCFNTFPFQVADDVAYYLIFVLEQLNFNPETIPLILMGNVEKGSELVDLLYRYVRHVEFGRRNESFKYSYMLNQVAAHAFFPLLNFFSCGL